MKPFLVRSNDSRSYAELVRELGERQAYVPCLRSGDLYEQLRNLVAGILAGGEVTLLDASLTDQEVAALVDPATLNREVQADTFVASEYELLARVAASQAKITLFTSGTTGQPKKVTHSFQRLLASARRDARFSKDVWAFAYSPTHMAGLQVIIQALSNLNTIVDVFGLPKDQALASMRDHGVTHVSATPTFYRLLLPSEFTLEQVQRVTLGGERSDERLHGRVKELFPKARISNIYASTEAGAILRAKGSVFEVGPEFKGKVRVEDGELQLHRSLLGETGVVDGEWYSTKDIVDVVCEDPLQVRIVARKNEMINVGGYKVNPSEVEQALAGHPDVLNAVVFARSNSVLGSILVAQVQRRAGSSLGEPEVRAYLGERLQPFKLPRMIKFVDKLEMTSTGKARLK